MALPKEAYEVSRERPYEPYGVRTEYGFRTKIPRSKEKGFEGTFDEWIRTAPIDELRDLLADGGPVDLSGLSVGEMKAIFRSENGRDPKNIKELVRGVKMYLKNMDLKGMPFKKDGGLISSYKANLRKP